MDVIFTSSSSSSSSYLSSPPFFLFDETFNINKCYTSPSFRHGFRFSVDGSDPRDPSFQRVLRISLTTIAASAVVTRASAFERTLFSRYSLSIKVGIFLRMISRRKRYIYIYIYIYIYPGHGSTDCEQYSHRVSLAKEEHRVSFISSRGRCRHLACWTPSAPW